MRIVNPINLRALLAAAGLMVLLPSGWAEETASSALSDKEAGNAVTVELPDLTTDYCEYVFKKKSMLVYTDIANIGAGQSGKAEIMTYFSYNDDGTELTFLKRYKLKKLKPGKIKTLKLKVKNVADWDQGYLYVWVDSLMQVPESDENNNYIYFGPFDT